MSLFKDKTKDDAALQYVERKQAEEIRRKEFCVDKAVWACDERPDDIIRTAEKIYKWIYGEEGK